MILILSFDTYEQGTDPVINWLLFHNIPFVKLSVTDVLQRKVKYFIDIDRQDIIIDGVSIMNDVKVVWHRRFMGEINLALSNIKGEHSEQLKSELRKEVEVLVKYLGKLLENKKWLTSLDGIEANKLEMLPMAAVCGLRVPRSKILNNKSDLVSFYDENQGKIISKAISGSRGTYQEEQTTFVMLTNVIDTERMEQIPEFFFPTLFQEKAEADYEIRVFYLDGKCYSTAILNSGKEKHVDRKVENYSVSTHFVTYNLPVDIEQKLRKFMEGIALNTGSIDVIRDINGEYIFLEVNPVGQFSAESERCNYYLEKEIAQWLVYQHQEAA
jgi:ATP-GRASP peptide maturase of grasp-with-spasm system